MKAILIDENNFSRVLQLNDFTTCIKILKKTKLSASRALEFVFEKKIDLPGGDLIFIYKQIN